MTVIKNQAFHWEKVKKGGWEVWIRSFCPQAPQALTQGEGDGVQLEVEARVVVAITEEGNSETETLKSPLNKGGGTRDGVGGHSQRGEAALMEW